MDAMEMDSTKHAWTHHGDECRGDLTVQIACPKHRGACGSDCPPTGSSRHPARSFEGSAGRLPVRIRNCQAPDTVGSCFLFDVWSQQGDVINLRSCDVDNLKNLLEGKAGITLDEEHPFRHCLEDLMESTLKVIPLQLFAVELEKPVSQNINHDNPPIGTELRLLGNVDRNPFGDLIVKVDNQHWYRHHKQNRKDRRVRRRYPHQLRLVDPEFMLEVPILRCIAENGLNPFRTKPETTDGNGGARRITTPAPANRTSEFLRALAKVLAAFLCWNTLPQGGVQIT